MPEETEEERAPLVVERQKQISRIAWEIHKSFDIATREADSPDSERPRPITEVMADCIAGWLESPSDIAGLPVSTRAKKLRSTLMNDVVEAPTAAVARQTLRTYAKALSEESGIAVELKELIGPELLEGRV